MLIPRFSLRLVLALNVVFALIFLAARFGAGGSDWALAILTGVFAATLIMSCFALMFAIGYCLSLANRFRQPVKTESPFARDKLPPQVIPPRDEISA